MQDLSTTRGIVVEKENAEAVGEIIRMVYDALYEKGYNPVNQIVGYILSGDPTYITNFKGARSTISKVERDEILEELVRAYVRKEEPGADQSSGIGDFEDC